MRSQARNRGGLEQFTQTQFHSKCRVGPRNDLRREKRMTTDVKEVLVDPDALDSENVAPDARDDLLAGAARRCVASID